jgi:hypothetical protein
VQLSCQRPDQIPRGRHAADTACLVAAATEREALADNHRLCSTGPHRGRVSMRTLHTGLEDGQAGAPAILALPAEDEAPCSRSARSGVARE